MLLTIAISFLTKLLIRVLLPTFGLPTIETLIPSFAFWSFLEDSMTCLKECNMILDFSFAFSYKPFPTYIIWHLLLVLRIRCSFLLDIWRQWGLFVKIISISILFPKDYSWQSAFRIQVKNGSNHWWLQLQVDSYDRLAMLFWWTIHALLVWILTWKANEK